jgi:hypothetical protein
MPEQPFEQAVMARLDALERGQATILGIQKLIVATQRRHSEALHRMMPKSDLPNPEPLKVAHGIFEQVERRATRSGLRAVPHPRAEDSEDDLD